MLRKIAKLPGALAVAAGIAVAAAPAMAQDAPRGKRAGDVVIGFGGIGVLPESGGRQVPLVGGTVKASNSGSAQLDATYFFTPNLAVNLIAATTQHDLRLQGSALGNLRLGHVWVLPPTLTFQYHFFPESRFSPYIGAGLNVTFFYGHGGSYSAPVNRVRVEPAVAPALNIGVDYELAPNWLLNVDAKKIWLRPDASVNSGLINTRVNLDPWVIGASVRYRF